MRRGSTTSRSNATARAGVAVAAFLLVTSSSHPSVSAARGRARSSPATTALRQAMPTRGKMISARARALAARKQAAEARRRALAARSSTLSPPRGRSQVGGASWYGPGFHGRRTASGERFNQNAMTLAHRSMPFGTRVRVTNLRTGRSVVGRVNDRGPFVRGRIVDLSAGMARRLGISGVAQVRVEVLPPPERATIGDAREAAAEATR